MPSRRCQGVIFHSQPWCTASTSILTRSALARGIGSQGRTDSHRLIEQRNKAPVVCPGRYQSARLFRCTVNWDGYHASEEEVQPTNLRSGEFPSGSCRCSHFVLCWVSHKRRHWRKGLDMHRPLPSAPTELAVPPAGTIAPAAERIVPPLPLPAPHLFSSNIFLAPSSAPHHAKPGEPGPFAQELFVLFLHVSEFLPPSSSYQWTTKTGLDRSRLLQERRIFTRFSSIGLPRSPDFGDDDASLSP